MFADRRSTGGSGARAARATSTTRRTGARRSAIGYAYYARLAGGPAGLFLLGDERRSRLFVRRFDRHDVRGAGARGHGRRGERGRASPGRRRPAARRLPATSRPTASRRTTPPPTTASTGCPSVLTTTSRRRCEIGRAASPPRRGHSGPVAASGPDAPVDAYRHPGDRPPPSPPVPVFGKTVVVKRVSGRSGCACRARKKFVDLGRPTTYRSARRSTPSTGGVELRRFPRAGGALRRSSSTRAVQGHAERGGHRVRAQRAAAPCRQARARPPRSRRRASCGATARARSAPRASTAPPRSAAPVARPGLLRGHAHAREAGQRERARQRQAQDDLVRAGKRYLAKPRRR